MKGVLEAALSEDGGIILIRNAMAVMIIFFLQLLHPHLQIKIYLKDLFRLIFMYY